MVSRLPVSQRRLFRIEFDWRFVKKVIRRFVLQNNYIQTTKYTLLSFVPVNLIEQFQRLANFYFLCLLVLQFIPLISSLTPVTTAVPLIGVLLLTAIKDAYDDFVSIFFAPDTLTYLIFPMFVELFLFYTLCIFECLATT